VFYCSGSHHIKHINKRVKLDVVGCVHVFVSNSLWYVSGRIGRHLTKFLRYENKKGGVVSETQCTAVKQNQLFCSCPAHFILFMFDYIAHV